MKIKAYSAYTTNTDIIMESSSGGVFTLLANNVILSGGVVFGAAFDENWNVTHIKVDKIEELGKLRGSKYVQSYMNNTFQDVKKCISEGLTVLFCGTPCQVNGLLSFLYDKYRSKLIAVDFACHGVPSSKIWKKYIGDTNNIKSLSFRNKKFGWKTYSMRIVYRNGKVDSTIFTHNKYMQAFISNITLRPSCYHCKAKGIDRLSDITLADFWGVSTYSPKMNNLQGTSLLLVHTQKGMSALNSINNKLVINEEDIEQAIKFNQSIVLSPNEPIQRKDFMDSLNNLSFDKLYANYVSHGLIKDFILYLKGYVKVGLYLLKIFLKSIESKSQYKNECKNIQ